MTQIFVARYYWELLWSEVPCHVDNEYDRRCCFISEVKCFSSCCT